MNAGIPDNSFSRSPALWVALAFATGIGLQYVFAFPPIPVFVGFLLILMAGMGFPRLRRSGLLLLILFLLMGILRFSLWHHTTLEHAATRWFPLKHVSVRAVVREPPSGEKPRCAVRILRIYWGEGEFPLERNFQFQSVATLPQNLLPGDTLLISRATLTHLPPVRNPGQPDFRRYLRLRGLLGQVVQESRGSLQVLPYGGVFHPGRIFFRWRRALEEKITRLVPGDASAFLIAVLLGEKSGLPRSVKREFQLTGVAHVLAISGLHVGFVAAFLYLLLSFLPISFKWNYALSLLLLTGYMLLTGAHAPVVRATLMLYLYLLGKILERKPRAMNTLFLAAFLILLWQPQQLFQVGFQYSFAAVFAILFIYRRLEPLRFRLRERIPRFGDKYLVVPFLVSLAAQLGTLPITAYYFKNIPLISFFLNLLVIPLTAVVVSVGFLMVGVAYVFEPLGVLLGQWLALLIRGETALVHLSLHSPLAYVSIPQLPILLIGVYLGMLLLLLYWRAEQLRIVRLPLLVLLLALLMWIFAPRTVPNQICMLDVGNGNATVVRTTRGSFLLFDAGPVTRYRDSGTDIIAPALAQMGVLHLDRVIISHPHADHLRGIFSLLQRVKIDSVYLPAISISYLWQDSVKHILKIKGIGFRELKLGDVVRVDAGARIYVLGPPEAFLHPPRPTGHAINNTSLITLLHLGNTRILFTGDAEISLEKALLGWGDLLRSEVLQVGHHGSLTSTSPEFLQQVNPRVALISVGRKNRYGHPAPQVVHRLARRGIRLFRTDQMGAIWLRWQHTRWQVWDWRKKLSENL